MVSVLHSVMLALLCLSVLAGPGNVSYSVDGVDIRGEGDSLRVRVSWSFSSWRAGASDVFVFGTTLKNGDDELELRPLALYGEGDVRLAPRRVSGDAREVQVVGLRSSGCATAVCETVVPYEPWMDTVKVLVSMREYSRGSLVLRSTGQKGCLAKPGRPMVMELPWSPLEPPESSGTRRVTFSAPVVFEEGSSGFDPDLGGNRTSMSRFLASLRSVTSTGRFRPSDAELVLRCAPGTDAPLVSSRLQSLYGWLRDGGAFASCRTRRTAGPEDWDAVREWISWSRYRDDARALEIVSMDAPSGERLSMLAKEKPALWEDLSAECLPGIGRVEFSADCVPLSFRSPRDARRVFDEVPEVLSPRDFWYISGMYEKSSPEWLEVILTGAAVHPSSRELACNAVLGLVSSGSYTRASLYLRDAGDSPEERYARAVWCYAAGRLDECADILEELAPLGLTYQLACDAVVPYIDWSLNYVRWESLDL